MEKTLWSTKQEIYLLASSIKEARQKIEPFPARRGELMIRISVKLVPQYTVVH
jgi:hypothetical protein